MEYEAKHGDSDVYLEYIRDELEKIERKIAPIERSELQEHEERLRQYREAYEPYRLHLRTWLAEVEESGKATRGRGQTRRGCSAHLPEGEACL